MDNFTSNTVTLTNYNQIYNQTIRPKLESLDLFLKTASSPYKIKEVCALLECEPEVITTAMEKLNMVVIDKLGLFNLIFYLPYDICKMIKNQWKYSSVKTYTPEIIADIYKLNVHKVTSAFNDLNIDSVDENNLTDIFQRIHMSVFPTYR